MAAGESTRMGQFKPLLSWQGTPLFQYQLQQLSASKVSDVLAVLGHDAYRLASSGKGIPKTRVIVNPYYKVGRTTSIKLGLLHLDPEAEAVMILAVDQPRPREVLDRLIDEHEKSSALITLPNYQGKHGHPIIFAKTLFPELRAISEEKQGLREVMSRHRQELNDIAFDTRIVLLDFNTPEQYEAALKSFVSSARTPAKPRGGSIIWGIFHRRESGGR